MNFFNTLSKLKTAVARTTGNKGAWELHVPKSVFYELQKELESRNPDAKQIGFLSQCGTVIIKVKS